MNRKFIKYLLAIFLILTSFTPKTFAQIDSDAVAILDNMSDVVTQLEACSFILKTEYDLYSSRFGLIKHSDVANVYLKAPDKLLVLKKGDKGEKSFYCDGKAFTYYSKDNNQYCTIPALPTIMETIDSIHNEYGVDFPAADVFYPDFVDRLIDISDNIAFLGYTIVDDKACYHVAGTTDSLTYQIWISKDDTLPKKIGIVYIFQPGNPQYEAIFSNWNISPAIEDSMFDFIVPDAAYKVTIKKEE